MFGSATITVTPEKITITKDGRGDIFDQKVGAITPTEWQKLTKSIDMSKYIALDPKDPRLKCKACAFDGENMESLEIHYDGTSKNI